MSLRGSFHKHTFTFRFDARTSRGAMKEKISWFIKVWDENDPSVVGVGECGPLPGLSPDDVPELDAVLQSVVDQLSKIEKLGGTTIFSIVDNIVPRGFPSVTFALETALLDLLNGGEQIIFKNSFLSGQRIPINGLVWMGDKEFMMEQVHEKVAKGFRCIKLKVGGIDFDDECRILEAIRSKYSSSVITLRLDANGAFHRDDAMKKLRALSKYDIHSIEQPVKPGEDSMVELCRQSPIAIALDEELIRFEFQKAALLKRIQPQYIILKPTLHGGLRHCQEWIEQAAMLNVGWWITSALESNIGLNAICQFTANYAVEIPQGLGTGSLYTENVPTRLVVDEGFIFLR